MHGFKQVTKAEFNSCIQKYFKKTGQQLSQNVCRISEPPIKTITAVGGKVIAKSILYDGSEYYSGKQQEYYIAEV